MASSAAVSAVGIVGGTGKLGSALAARLVMAGRTVIIGSRSVGRAEATALAVMEHAAATAGRPRGSARGGSNDAAFASAGIVVIAVPFASLADTVAALRVDASDRVVVSTAVPVRFERGREPVHIEVDEGSAAEQLAALLPGALVVGALQTVSHVTLQHLDRAIDADVLLTGDDVVAKRAVAGVLAAIDGVRPVDGGGLHNSRYVEQFTVLLLTINMRHRTHAGLYITGLQDDDLGLTAQPA